MPDAMRAEEPTTTDARVLALESENALLRGELARAHDALASLRARYHQILEELHLLKRRLHVAKAERLDDVADAQLAFNKLTAEAKALEKVLDDAAGRAETSAPPPPPPPPPPPKKSRKTLSAKPTGRRKLSDCDLPEVRVEIPDPELEGKFERIGFEVSTRVGHERGGRRRARLRARRVQERGERRLEDREPQRAARGSGARAALRASAWRRCRRRACRAASSRRR